jgi:hypothetical protein
MYRDEGDLELMAELAGVLDEVVTDAGLSAGSYLVLRALVADSPQPVTALAARLRADPEEVAGLGGRLVQGGLAEVGGGGLSVSALGRERAEALETSANDAMRRYVLDRPHTATVYGLVAAMQAGRFTVEDLIAFLEEEPEEEQAGG